MLALIYEGKIETQRRGGGIHTQVCWTLSPCSVRRGTLPSCIVGEYVLSEVIHLEQ